jgi:two-component system response regulator AtoC
MPLSLQVKLLRVLQEEEIRRVGAAVSRKINVRVVSATSRDLESDVRRGRFREDLFFRLNVFCITLPPLRERAEDIPQLVNCFAGKYTTDKNTAPVRCSPDAMRRLLGYSWPGNIRELENVIERCIILCDGVAITVDVLPPALHRASEGCKPACTDENLSIKQAEDAIERDLIRKALIKTRGNRTQAARILEISHRSLLYKLKEFGIE